TVDLLKVIGRIVGVRAQRLFCVHVQLSAACPNTVGTLGPHSDERIGSADIVDSVSSRSPASQLLQFVRSLALFSRQKKPRSERG
ncbi:hypothetical protein, partial [Pseudomonas sp.]|uniref:hypothetical protein n=1 Tax=Pseudomonas sp. TaxID=306 RepID=UPI003262FE14